MPGMVRGRYSTPAPAFVAVVPQVAGDLDGGVGVFGEEVSGLLGAAGGFVGPGGQHPPQGGCGVDDEDDRWLAGGGGAAGLGVDGLDLLEDVTVGVVMIDESKSAPGMALYSSALPSSRSTQYVWPMRPRARQAVNRAAA
ncbi:hypothetical protein ACIBJF_42570 [Streptomyces sp. NPDC050743]|uniref:hypothetical protein n=1 Tax=Streptomyces sp. NPDC050743 TaxID=3365634 RepID=UPI0037AF467D